MKTLSLVSNSIIKLRYFLGIIIIFICIQMNINGSSMGMWHQYINDENVPYSTVIGTPRAIRSDEWATTTPEIFSQEYTEHPFSITNNLIRGGDIDIALYPGLPTLDFTLLFRPFLSGYVFGNKEIGLSFFWSARSVFLWLAAFELCRLFTKKSNLLSTLFATSVLFAPGIQWWFTSGGLIEMIVGGSYFLLGLDSYLKSIPQKKALFPKLLLMFYGGGMFLMTLYPAWMVPLGYVFLSLTIFILAENNALKVLKKRNYIQILITGILLFSGFSLLLYRSKETIFCILESDYPGHQVNYGGGHFQFMFYYLGNILYKNPNASGFDKSIFVNECESSGFFGLFPFSLLLTLIVLFLLIKQKKKLDTLLILGLVVSLLFILFSSTTLPPFFAKILLLSFSKPKRLILIFHFLNLILTARCIYLIKEKEINLSIVSRLVILASAGISSVFLLKINSIAMADYMDNKSKVLLILILFIPAICIVLKNKITPLAFLVIACASVYSGFLVNPINIGTAKVLETKLAKEIREVVESHPADLWVVDYYYPVSDYPLMMGAKTFNSTQPYPITKDLKKLTGGDMYRDKYNRFAHISCVIGTVSDMPEEKISFIGGDHLYICLTPDDLKLLNIKRILSPRNLKDYSTQEVEIKPTGSYNNYYLHEVIY